MRKARPSMPGPEKYAAAIAWREHMALYDGKLTSTHTRFGRSYLLLSMISRLFARNEKVNALIIGCGAPNSEILRGQHLPPEPFEVANQLENVGADYRVSVIDYAYQHPEKTQPVLAHELIKTAFPSYTLYLHNFFPSVKRVRIPYVKRMVDGNPIRIVSITPPPSVLEKISFYKGNALRELPVGRGQPNLVVSLNVLRHYTSETQREAILSSIAAAVAPKGYLLVDSKLALHEISAFGLEPAVRESRKGGVDFVYRKR